MDIYLPIAAISQNVFVLLALGGGVGFLSGVFGVGGGFLLTPLLIFCMRLRQRQESRSRQSRRPAQHRSSTETCPLLPPT